MRLVLLGWIHNSVTFGDKGKSARRLRQKEQHGKDGFHGAISPGLPVPREGQWRNGDSGGPGTDLAEFHRFEHGDGVILLLDKMWRQAGTARGRVVANPSSPATADTDFARFAPLLRWTHL